MGACQQAPFERAIFVVQVDAVRDGADRTEHRTQVEMLLDGDKIIARELAGVLRQQSCRPLKVKGLKFTPTLERRQGFTPSLF